MPPNAVRREIGGAWHSGLPMLTHTADGEQEFPTPWLSLRVPLIPPRAERRPLPLAAGAPNLEK
ncbi:hypothetical protein GCM10010270_30100 [Streptomyces violaceus]|nr:hypothetical protein GCM10010270_30100 [Streptomyces janthinus]